MKCLHPPTTQIPSPERSAIKKSLPQRLNFPLILTLARIVLTPLFSLFYLYPESFGFSITMLPYVLLSLVLVSELSDIFDGIVARRHNQVTALGKVLDPMADSIFRLSVFFTMTQGLIQLPLLLVLTLFFRDSVTSTLRTLCALRGVTLAARLSGKVKAVAQAAVISMILLLMIPFSWGWISHATLQTISSLLVTLVTCYTCFSGVEYIWANRFFIKKSIE